ncbi:MAG: 30S ribosomal protein S6 [Clostridia bacterium]|nr:30S ribosomal protein S6 [Clostridia bacterium]
MRNYETIFILDMELTEEARAEQIAKVKAVIENGGGEILTVDEWGKKRLAYAINYKKEGYYVYVTFKAGAETPEEMERIYRITEGILKGLIISLEK